MILSKKNFDQLKSLLNEENSSILKNKINSHNSTNNNFSKDNSSHISDPNELFYSIIDNTNNLEQTTLSNSKLKECEANFIKSNSSFNSNSLSLSPKKNKDNLLSNEDLMYDEFNYLLEE
tara:strand:+ start:25371 stop:25730 length:360 start_codon:yes stop_codon:yes gene_type:complete